MREYLVERFGMIAGNKLADVLGYFNVGKVSVKENCITLHINDLDIKKLNEQLSKIVMSSQRFFRAEVRDNKILILLNDFNVGLEPSMHENMLFSPNELIFHRNPVVFLAALEKEIISLFYRLEMLITEKRAEATANHKKLIILVGDGGPEKRSLIIELILIAIAKKHGIKNFLISSSPQDLLRRRKTTPIDGSPNFHFLLPIFEENRFNIIAEIQHIFHEQFLQINEDMLYITGFSFIPEIIADQEFKKAYTFLPISVAMPERLHLEFGHEPVRGAAVVSSAGDSSNVTQLNIKLDMHHMLTPRLINITLEVLERIIARDSALKPAPSLSSKDEARPKL